MQKIINVLAVASFLVSGAVVGAGVYVYTQKDALIEQAKKEALKSVTELLGGSELGSTLISGAADNIDVSDAALGAESSSIPVPIPVVPF